MAKINLVSITLDSANYHELADFYMKLLQGKIEVEYEGYYVAISISNTNIQLGFQNAEGYEPPVWPEEAGKPQQMVHLDFSVDNLEEAVQHATELGAKKAPQQFIPEIVVMLDPAGHPFCLCPRPD